jgi:DNA polymerase (family 10)
LIKREDVPGAADHWAVQNNIQGEVVICGGYRRGKAESHDIDLVIILDEPSQCPEKKIVRGQFYGVMIDPFWCHRSCAGAMILHATGSGEFNKLLRWYAKRQGYKLNQYGLFMLAGKKVIRKSEEDIFEALGLDFIPPEWRTYDNLKEELGV